MRSNLVGVASVLLAVIALAGAVLGGLVSSAGAAPRAVAATSATTCPSTYSFAGNSDATVPCTPPTTSGGYHPRLTITYHPDGHAIGVVDWQACGYPPSADGLAVRLELNGRFVGPVGRIEPGSGCTNDPHFEACLSQGHYTAVDVVQGYPSASATVVIDASSGCTAAGGGTGSRGSTRTVGVATAASASKAGGLLAFTGADIRRYVIVGVLAIMIGLVLLRVSRRRSTLR